MKRPSTYDAIIVGAGAAGLFCAIEAGRRGRRVAVLDHADRPGKKILISGGGRCNFTNLYCGPQDFLSGNPHFAKSALARYTPADFIALVESHGIAYHEKTLGQLFCDGSARQIVAMLLAECAEAGVDVVLRTAITSVEQTDEGFTLYSDEASFKAEKLVIATGGLSIAKMGATSFGYDIARQFGLKIVECRPALVPLLLDGADQGGICDLAGVSARVEVAIGRRRFLEKLLVTHRGLSGPAILQISSYWRPGVAVAIDWAPGLDLFGPLMGSSMRRDDAAARASLRSHETAALAHRLIDRLLELAIRRTGPTAASQRSSSSCIAGSSPLRTPRVTTRRR